MIDTFGKNEYVKKVFWTLLVAMAGLVLARVVDGDNSAGGGDYYGEGGVMISSSFILRRRYL
jgi:hypothetical protein